MISVALCTYNGETHIASQLKSILSQTYPVDEIIIVDDCSTDDTVAIINEIKAKGNADGWVGTINIVKNSVNIGALENFKKAIDLCSGDIILLSDQDDEWAENKVERIQQWFSDNRSKEVVFTNGYLVEENGERINGNPTIFDVLFRKYERDWFDVGFAVELFGRNNRAVGATIAFRKEIKPFIDFSTDSDALHDERLCFSAISRNSLGYCDEPLINYRLHQGQTVGLGDWKAFSQRLLSVEDPRLTPDRIMLLSNRVLQRRFDFSLRRFRWIRSVFGAVLLLFHIPGYILFYKKNGLISLSMIINYDECFMTRIAFGNLN